MKYKQLENLLGQAEIVLSNDVVAETDLSLEPYVDILNRLYVADVNHGHLVVPKRYRDDPWHIPLVMTGPGKLTISGDVLGFTSDQSEVVKTQLSKWGLGGEAVQRHIDQFNADLMLRTLHPQLDDKNQAKVVTAQRSYLNYEGFGLISSDPNIRSIALFGRPVIVFPQTPRRSRPNLYAGMLFLHELTHVKQFLDSPLELLSSVEQFDDRRMERELEAYHFEAIIGRALVKASLIDRATRTADKIEAARSSENLGRENPFKLTERLRLALIDEGYDDLPDK